MRTTHLFFLLSLLILSAGTVRAQGQEKTYWKNLISDMGIGTDENSTDIQISITEPESDTTYIVKTAKGLAWIAMVTNSGKKKGDEGADNNYPSAAGFEGCTVKLEPSSEDGSINLSKHYWTPIGMTVGAPFKGTFDGKHKMVTGLKVKELNTVDSPGTDSDCYAGLFGYLYFDSSVSNLGIQIDAEGVEGNSQKGASYVGGLAGYNRGTIRNCFVTHATGGDGKGSIKSTENCGNYKHVGGLVGRNDGTITNSYTTVDVSTQYGKPSAGGIAGSNTTSVSNVYATGKVETSDVSRFDSAGGIIGRFWGGTLSNALALNKDGIKGSTNGSEYGTGRVAGGVYQGEVKDSCYASTKIRVNNNVKGTSGSKEDCYYSDGLDADTDLDLTKLFPTGEKDVWKSGGEGNLPVLKGFGDDNATSNDPQPTLAIEEYLDKPLTLSNGDYNLSYTATDGWKSQLGAYDPTPFSGRVKSDKTVTGPTLSINPGPNDVVLTFADGFEISSAGTDKATITVYTSNDHSIIFASEGTATVRASSPSGNALSVVNNSTCSFDAAHSFLLYGGISIADGSTLNGLMQWQWDESAAAPQAAVTADWGIGSATFACLSGNTCKSLATNPGGKDVTLKLGNDFLKGKAGSEGEATSTFNFTDNETKPFITYTITGSDEKGTQGNPYTVDLSAVTDAAAAANGYTYDATNHAITLSQGGGYYRLQGKRGDSETPLVLTFDAPADNKSFYLYPSSGACVDTLKVPTGVQCHLDNPQSSDSLRATSVQVCGTLTIDAPLTVEMEEVNSSDYAKSTGLYVYDDGAVAVNDTLRAFASGGSAYAIRIGKGSASTGTLMVESKGVVYAYGTGYGCNLGEGSSLKVNEGGIIRLATKTMFALYFDYKNYVDFASIEWQFATAPDAILTVKEKDNSSEYAAFSDKEFGEYFKDAKHFAANVAADAEYTLWKDGKQLSGTTSGKWTESFTAKVGVRELYLNVGEVLTINDTGKVITITGDGKYKEGENGDEKSFSNMLSGEMKSLYINKGDGVVLKDVTITDSLVIIKKNYNIYLNTAGNTTSANRLGIVEVKKGATLWLYSSGGATITGTEFVNSGTFYDYSGLADRVKIPQTADADTLVVLRPTCSGETEVTPGGTTTLTAAGVLGESIPITKAGTDGFTYLWYKWNDEGSEWKYISTATSPTLTAGAGRYRCGVIYIVKVDNSDVQTYLYTSPVEVTTKSAPPYVPPVPTYYTVTLPALTGASLDRSAGRYTVEDGYSFTFTLTLDDAYDRSQPVVTIDRNGGETLVADTLADRRLKYRIRSVEQDLVVAIVGIARNDDTPTALDGQPRATAVSISSYGGLLHIETPAATTVRLYDFQGRLLRTVPVPVGYTSMQKPSGPCILLVGEQRFKVGGE